MKQLFLGMILGALITCVVFYFINKSHEQEKQDNLATLVDLIKQGQAKNQQTNETINDSTAMLVVPSPLTIIVTPNDDYYFYRDRDCGKLEKVNLATVKELLSGELKDKRAGDYMIIIKMMQGTTFNNSVKLLDAISNAGIAPGHYAEVALSENEKNCIKNYKKD